MERPGGLGWAAHRCRQLGGLLWWWEARLRGAEVDPTAQFIGRPILSVARGSQFRLGPGVMVVSAVRGNPLGCFQPSVLRTLQRSARLELGPNVGLSGAVLCAGREIVVGEGTIFGSGAMVLDNDFHQPDGEWGWRYDTGTEAKPVRIGRGCFIGARAIILKGVTLGDRAIVGAGAVVTRDVPAGQIAAGNPAVIHPPRGA